MNEVVARHNDCFLSLVVRSLPSGRRAAVLTVDGAGVSDDVARALETIAAEMADDFGTLSRYVLDLHLYAGRFTVSGLSDQAALFAAHGVTDLRFCYLLNEESFDQIRILVVELFARQGVTLTSGCCPALDGALDWLDTA
jgi:hypothetical protein